MEASCCICISSYRATFLSLGHKVDGIVCHFEHYSKQLIKKR